jgi:hypothetical protein
VSGKPRGHCNSDGVDRPAPAAQNHGVGLHLHVRDLAPRFAGFVSTTFFPMALSDYTQLFQRGGSQSLSQSPRSQILDFYVQRRKKSAERPMGGDLYSKLRAPHRGMSLGPFVCVANNIRFGNLKNHVFGQGPC